MCERGENKGGGGGRRREYSISSQLYHFRSSHVMAACRKVTKCEEEISVGFVGGKKIKGRATN